MIINSNTVVVENAPAVNMKRNIIAPIGDCKGYTQFGQSNYYACKPKDNTDTAIKLTDSIMTSFRIVAKIKHNALSDNEKSCIMYANSSVELDMGRWGSGTPLFLSLGLYNSAWEWTEVDLTSSFSFDSDAYYYYVAYYDKTAGEATTAIYDESGTRLGYSQRSRTSPINSAELYLGGNGTSALGLKGYMDIADSFIEKNGEVIWGKKTDKTQNMGIIE